MPRELRTADSDELRDSHHVQDENGNWVRATRLEAARTNELHNSDSPATQTRSLTAGTYTLWMEGSGSVDASGATDGSYGTATEGQANDLTFTVSTTQDVTFTVNNTVTRFQCEEGSFRSSFIATTSSAVSRAADSLTFPISFGPQELSLYCKIVETGGSKTGIWLGRLLTVGNGRSSGTVTISIDPDSSGYKAVLHDDNGSFQLGSPLTAPSIGDVVELLLRWERSSGQVRLVQSINGGTTTEDSMGDGSGGDSWHDTKIRFGHQSSNAVKTPADFITGPIIAPGVRTMDECRSLAGVA